MTSVVVVGAGLAGAAAAWRLASAGAEVTLLERTRPAGPEGSSHGSARILRYTYHDEFYAELMVRARAGWTELEQLAGEKLLTPTGALDYGETRDPRYLAGVLEHLGVEHELLDAVAASERWPGLRPATEVLWHPDAAVIDAERAVFAMVALAAVHGAAVEHDWPVDRVETRSGGFRVHAEDGRTVDAERVVVAVGGWLPDLLDRIPLPAGARAVLPSLEVTQEQAFHFPYRDAPGPWPATIHKSPAIEVYTLAGGRDAGHRGQKVAEYRGGRILPSAASQDDVVSAENRARVVAYVEEHLPGLVPEPYAETTCLFTSTPNDDFLVDVVDGVTLVSPCSGHGAKFAPLIGLLAAEATLGTAPAPQRFRVTR